MAASNRSMLDGTIEVLRTQRSPGARTIRVKLIFDTSPPLHGRMCWLLVDPVACDTISDLEGVVKSKFGLNDICQLRLSIDGFLLPSTEKIGVVQESDTIRVEQILDDRSNWDNLSSNGDAIIGIKKHKKHKKSKKNAEELKDELNEITKSQRKLKPKAAEPPLFEKSPLKRVREKTDEETVEKSCQKKLKHNKKPESKKTADTGITPPTADKVSKLFSSTNQLAILEPEGKTLERAKTHLKTRKATVNGNDSTGSCHLYFDYDSDLHDSFKDQVDFQSSTPNNSNQAAEGSGSKNLAENISAAERSTEEPPSRKRKRARRRQRTRKTNSLSSQHNKADPTGSAVNNREEATLTKNPSEKNKINSGLAKSPHKLVSYQTDILSNKSFIFQSPEGNTTVGSAYDKIPAMSEAPKRGDCIAYQILELSSTYCPEVSSYKEGRVVGVNSETGTIEIEIIKGHVPLRSGKFEISTEEVNECDEIVENKDITNWRDLINLKLLSSKNLN